MPKWSVHFDMRLQTGDSKLVAYVANARALASVIRGLPIPPHVQQRLDHLNIVRAVRGTTGIEGAELTEEEVGQIVQAPPDKRVLSPSRNREEQEARNAEALMIYVADLLAERPDGRITEHLIKKFHEIITENIQYPHNEPGRYRTYYVNVGDYVPPETGDKVRALMAQFIEWFNTGPLTGWDPVIRAVVAHFYVISIHPFGDGNGRTSRAIESYLLYQAGINSRGYYSLANYYYRRRSDYVRMLDLVRFRSHSDLTPFVLFALEGLVEELEAVHEEVLTEVRIIAFRDFARETLSTQGKIGTPPGERQLHFLQQLRGEPVSLKELRDGTHPLSVIYRGVTAKTLSRDINFLTQHNLVVISGNELRANLDIMTQFTA